ncbi:MAG: class I SAM-dependent methyltransferase [Lachnospiraceae bacterium]|nr:class I SAM-dependent methyltransferase [Lachnospiraceae bacterium]
MDKAKSIKEDVVSYWGARSQDFAAQRKRELESSKAGRWKKEILPFLPKDRKETRILDVGTGSGFFPILLAEEGYENVTGIDLTPEMIERAKDLSQGLVPAPSFFVMDAEKPDFEKETFDVILTRNLTWTLPHPDLAYREWYRLLKTGGLLLNFDADYGEEEESAVELPENHAHKGIASELMRKHDQIMAALPNSYLKRPGTDVELLKLAGFSTVTVDFQVSDRVYREIDEFYNPVRMFKLCARK